MPTSNKIYIVDTNVLLDDPNCITELRNGEENEVIVPFSVLIELDKLKKKVKTSHFVKKAITQLKKSLKDNHVRFIRNLPSYNYDDTNDLSILTEIDSFMKDSSNKGKIITFVTNDKLLQVIAESYSLKVEEYKRSKPFQSESEIYTGFTIEKDEKISNSFKWIEPEKIAMFHGVNNEKLIDFTMKDIWKIVPKDYYQNLALFLLLNPKIDLITIQSAAGLGKTTLALAAALHLTQMEKSKYGKPKYEKIYVVKPTIEVGTRMGFLPGDIEEKLDPYIKPIEVIIQKLDKLKACKNKIYNPKGGTGKKFNTDYFEILPLGYIRGLNIENAVVIVDECQNLSRIESRSLLTRMGENVKCICLGDTSQVDHPYLNEYNNGLNWMVKMLKNQPNYAHIVLKGSKSRGPICDTVLRSGL